MNAMRLAQARLERRCDWTATFEKWRSRDHDGISKSELYKFWASLDMLAQLDALRSELSRTEEAARRDGNLEAARCYFLGRMLQTQGLYGEALAAYMLYEVHARDKNARHVLWLQLGSIAYLLDNRERAKGYLARASEEAQSQKDWTCVAQAADMTAACYLAEGKLDACKTQLKVAGDFCKRTKNQYRAAWIQLVKGELFCAQGDLNKGRREMEEAYARFRAWGAIGAVFHSARHVAKRWLQGDSGKQPANPRRAWELLEEVQPLRLRFLFNAGIVEWHRLRVECKRLLGDLDKAEEQQILEHIQTLSRLTNPFVTLFARKKIMLTREDVETHVNQLDFEKFERLCFAVLKRDGFHCSWAPVNEQGVDFYAERSGDGFSPIKIAVSCKHRTRTSVKEADITGVEKVTGVDACDAFMLMTNARISTGAQNKLKGIEKARIRVSVRDGESIIEFVMEHPDVLWGIE